MTSPLRNIVLLGYGLVGQALSPLLRARYPDCPILAIDQRMDAQQLAVAHAHCMDVRRLCITRSNHTVALDADVGASTLVVNIATSIDSRDMIAWTQQRAAHYLDTCIDPWVYRDGELAANTNYRLREGVLELQAMQRASGRPQPTAVIAHGANPGLVSLLVKRALLMMARRHLPGADLLAPREAADWARLAEALGIRVIQISERDAQTTRSPRAPGEFVNTWSVDGFIAEALQPAELGWGSHEYLGPMAALAQHHDAGCQAAVYLPCTGAQARVRSWSPRAGAFTGWLISHNEAISIADHLTLGPRSTPQYRPTVYYAYHPCDAAAASLSLLRGGDRSGVLSSRLLMDEIDAGIDELGVLLLSDRHPGLWLGSQLSIEQARERAPHNNATSLQVVGSMMAAIQWIQRHPWAGIVESEAMDKAEVLVDAYTWWDPLVHEYRRWHPRPELAAPRWTLDEFWAGPALEPELSGASAAAPGPAVACP